MAIFGEFLRPVFSASRVQHVSDLHPKFALTPHVWKYGRHPPEVGIPELINLPTNFKYLLSTTSRRGGAVV